MREEIKLLLVFLISLAIANLISWLILGQFYFVATLIGSIISTISITLSQKQKKQ